MLKENHSWLLSTRDRAASQYMGKYSNLHFLFEIATLIFCCKFKLQAYKTILKHLLISALVQTCRCDVVRHSWSRDWLWPFWSVWNISYCLEVSGMKLIRNRCCSPRVTCSFILHVSHVSQIFQFSVAGFSMSSLVPSGLFWLIILHCVSSQPQSSCSCAADVMFLSGSHANLSIPEMPALYPEGLWCWRLESLRSVRAGLQPAEAHGGCEKPCDAAPYNRIIILHTVTQIHMSAGEPAEL